MLLEMAKMSKAMSPWLLAARPRTLLLAASSIGLGLLLAAAAGPLQGLVALLSLITAALLQILSNLANDYGDARHGADAARSGPPRAVQSGLVSSVAMLRAAVIVAVIAALSGLALVALAFGFRAIPSLLLVALGGAALWAAVAYTATPRPYGYRGLGDPMVFVFFGPVAVLGSYLLQRGTLEPDLLLPAAASGLLAVAVLNINNLRDLDSDRAAGKRSLAVRLGPRRARLYHLLLLAGSALAGVLYAALEGGSAARLLVLLALPLLALNGWRVWRARSPADLDPLLKGMALAALAFCLLLGLGQVLA